MSSNRVVITGMGAATPLGCDTATLWRNIRRGKSAVRQIELEGIGPICAGTIDEQYRSRPDRCLTFAVDAAEQALSAALERNSDLACYISASKGGMAAFEQAHSLFLKKGWRGLPENFFENFLTSSPAVEVSKQLGLGGTNLNFPFACATGLVSIAVAAEHIHCGRQKAVLAGAAEASVTALIIAGFNKMKVLSRRTDTPQEAMRPFDCTRDGFVIGEGAGAVLMESRNRATKRAAPILAEVAGWAYGCDHRNMVGLGGDCELLSKIIAAAIKKAEIKPRDIDYINVHGTATVENDIFETNAIKKALGSAAHSVAISSTKPFTCHLLGASGAVETVITVLAMNDDYIPPTLNLHRPDPGCDLNYTPLIGVRKRIRHALVLNYGFGGHMAALVLRKIGRKAFLEKR